MTTLLTIGLSNAAAVAILTPMVAIAARGLKNRPALVHGLWLLVLLKVVTPPLFTLPIGPLFPDPDATDSRIGAERHNDVPIDPTPSRRLPTPALSVRNDSRNAAVPDLVVRPYGPPILASPDVDQSIDIENAAPAPPGLPNSIAGDRCRRRSGWGTQPGTRANSSVARSARHRSDREFRSRRDSDATNDSGRFRSSKVHVATSNPVDPRFRIVADPARDGLGVRVDLLVVGLGPTGPSAAGDPAGGGTAVA